MAYTIHTIGKMPEFCKDREDAIWALGSRYGAKVINRARKMPHAIVWCDEYVKVRPDKIALIQDQITKERNKRGW